MKELIRSCGNNNVRTEFLGYSIIRKIVEVSNHSISFVPNVYVLYLSEEKTTNFSSGPKNPCEYCRFLFSDKYQITFTKDPAKLTTGAPFSSPLVFCCCCFLPTQTNPFEWGSCNYHVAVSRRCYKRNVSKV
jgi:hypothetical protein